LIHSRAITGRHVAAQMCPTLIRRKAAAIMSDGRWRTSSDVAVRVGCTTGQASKAMRRLEMLGLIEKQIVRDGHGNATIYRKATREAAE
jgi:predicted transcriptional regulator